MGQTIESIEQTHVVEVYGRGRFEIIYESPNPTSWPVPDEPGVWQFRPIGFAAAQETEFGARVPVYGWAPGAFDPTEWAPLHLLPNIGDWDF